MSKPDWRQFFATHGDYDIPVHYYESERTVSIEELYQAFKARLRDEPPMTRAERIVQLHAEIDALIASDSDGGEAD